MTLDLSSVSLNSVRSAETFPASTSDTAASKVAAPPPPPPPPPPPKDVVQLSLASEISRLKYEGDSTVQISQELGVPVQTISVYLGSSFLETTLASAPSVPETSKS